EHDQQERAKHPKNPYRQRPRLQVWGAMRPYVCCDHVQRCCVTGVMTGAGGLTTGAGGFFSGLARGAAGARSPRMANAAKLSGSTSAATAAGAEARTARAAKSSGSPWGDVAPAGNWREAK